MPQTTISAAPTRGLAVAPLTYGAARPQLSRRSAALTQHHLRGHDFADCGFACSSGVVFEIGRSSDAECRAAASANGVDFRH